MRRKRRRAARIPRLAWLAAALLAAFVAARGQPAPAEPRDPGARAEPPSTPSTTPGAAGPAAERPPRRAVPPDSPFFSPEACAAHLRAHPRKRARGPRIATWNVRWFPDGAAKPRAELRTDVDWLACAVAALDVDVLAVQEFVQHARGRAATLDLRARLDALTSGRWRDAFDDCASGSQHVGFLYDARRVELRGQKMVASLNPGMSACDRSLRPGFAAYARFAGGPDLTLLTVHLDSGVEPRDYANRRTSISRLRGALAALAREHGDEDVLLLGDLNTMGCQQCTTPVSADDELAQLDEELRPLGLARVPPRDGHACTQYRRGRSGLLDHVLAPSAMRELGARPRVEVHGPCRDLGCGRAARGERVAAWYALSDHCPVVIELEAEDRD